MLVFQLSLATGAPLGRWAWGGEYQVLPANLRIGSLFSAGVFLLGAVWALELPGVIRGFGRPGLAKTGAWVLAALFFSSGVLNLFQAGEGEKAVMVPVAFLLAFLFAFIARTQPPRRPNE
jgi:uncharacterized membrane protein